MTAKYLPTYTASKLFARQRGGNIRQRILVVDDEALIRRLNSEVLLYSGYQVDAAADGAAAWEALNENNYDLLITDNEMPNLTGLELLKKVYTAQLDMPAIMATGNLPTWEFAQYPMLQPEAILLKPYTFDEFLDTVKGVLHTAAAGRQETTPPPSWQFPPRRDSLRA